jgi:hypothetical protein
MPRLRDRKIARSVGEGAERGKRPKGEGEVQRAGVAPCSQSAIMPLFDGMAWRKIALFFAIESEWIVKNTWVLETTMKITPKIKVMRVRRNTSRKIPRK